MTGATPQHANAAATHCEQTVAWAALAGHFEAHGRGLDLREAFASDARRFERFSVDAPELFADLSKCLWDGATKRLLLELARDCQLEARRDAMLAGEPINTTEGRAVLHTALRAPRGQGLFSDEVHGVLDRLLAYAESVRRGAHSADGAGGPRIRHVVNIGIGGSDLGPRLVVQALAPLARPEIKMHFVSNVDGHDISAVLRGLKAEETLFIIASKTFTTQETMANAEVARQWFLAQGGQDVGAHFVGVTTNLEAAAAFGIHTTFGFWDWVGGRYSLWSAIGLPIAIAVGAEGFCEFLAGAHAMDQHYAHTPLESNLPAQLGLLDVWYRNFHRFASRSVAPYHQGLARLPAYLQQLEMESNGKHVGLDGRVLPYDTCGVVWGEPGTNGQHAYFQMLHQGTEVVPVEFILVKKPAHGHADLHEKLLANGLAQGAALMLGKTTEAALAEKAPTASASLDAMTVARHRTFAGNRPSVTLLVDALTPRALGALIALYEHRVFTAGSIWGINPFDQWGVELGKALCGQLLPRLQAGDARGDVTGLDGSTAGLLQRLIAP